jgi:hypothetical protein
METASIFIPANSSREESGSEHMCEPVFIIITFGCFLLLEICTSVKERKELSIRPGKKKNLENE